MDGKNKINNNIDNLIKDCLLEINNNDISFYQRVYKHGRTFFIIVFFSILVASLLTGEIALSFIFGLLFMLIILVSIVKWNIYYIKYIKMNHKYVELKVYKYNSIIIEGQFHLSDFSLKIERASVSKRGVSYKMHVSNGQIQFSQYEIHGWNKVQFDKIIALS